MIQILQLELNLEATNKFLHFGGKKMQKKNSIYANSISNIDFSLASGYFKVKQFIKIFSKTFFLFFSESIPLYVLFKFQICIYQ